MPYERFGNNHPIMDAARVRSLQGLGSVGDSNSAANLIAGADITINGNIIQRSGNKILLFDSGGAVLNEYAATQAGLTAALAAWTSGDTVWLPSLPIALTSGITTAATIKGIDLKASLNFSGFSGAAITLQSGGWLENLSVVMDGSGQAVATGVSSTGTTLGTKIIGCYISAINATSNFGVRLSGTANYNGPQIDKSFVDAASGGSNVAYELGDYAEANFCYGGAKSGSTSNIVVNFIGTQATIGTPLATHCWFIGGSTSTDSWGGQVDTGKTGRATHCYFEGNTGGLRIKSGGTLSAYADHWNTLSNSGVLIHLPGDLSVGGGSSMLSNVFVVTDYGATGNGTTDDTASVQATIDAATAAGGGIVYFPAGVYLIAGALQDTGGANAQLLLPTRAITQQELTLTLQGALAPNFERWDIGSSLPLPVNGYSIIKSNLTGASGTACLIAGIGPVGGIYNREDWIKVTFQDLTFEMPPDPSLTCIDMTNMCSDIFRVFIHCGTVQQANFVEPTHTNAYGVRFPMWNRQGHMRADAIEVLGYYNAYEFGELAIIGGLSCGGCKRAFKVPFAYHSNIALRLFCESCAYGIWSDDSGDAYIDVLNFDIEHTTSPAWQVTIADLYDPTNRLHGTITWLSVTGGVGVDHTFTINGASHMITHEVGTLAGGSGTVTNIATGTGLTGGPITTTGTIALADTAVVLGSYGDAANIPQLTIDQQGRITSAANVAISTLTPINVYNETLTADGVNLTYYLTNYAAPGTIRVWIDGIRQPASDDTDPTDIVTFDVAPDAGALLLFDYEMDQS